jgi:hypothetical protein
MATYSLTALADSYSQSSVSDYIYVYDEDAGNTVVSVSNVSNVVISPYQRGVTVTANGGGILFSGAWSQGNTENIVYYERPFGNDFQNTATVVYSYSAVPPEKFVTQINYTYVGDTTASISFTAGLVTGDSLNFSTNKTIRFSLQAAYDFIINYYKDYITANVFLANTYNTDVTWAKTDSTTIKIDKEGYI